MTNKLVHNIRDLQLLPSSVLKRNNDQNPTTDNLERLCEGGKIDSVDFVKLNCTEKRFFH